MDEQRDTTDLDVVTENRGQEIERRFDALGIADREWYRLTGIDRKTLNRAIAGAGTRGSTYTAILHELDRLEKRVGGVEPSGDDYVEFTVEGNFGVRAVVKGPVKDMAALQEAVARLVRDMRPEPPPPDET